MTKQSFIWNIHKTRCIKLSTIRSFTVYSCGTADGIRWRILASMSNTDTTLISEHTTKEEAENAVFDLTREAV